MVHATNATIARILYGSAPILPRAIPPTCFLRDARYNLARSSIFSRSAMQIRENSLSIPVTSRFRSFLLRAMLTMQRHLSHSIIRARVCPRLSRYQRFPASFRVAENRNVAFIRSNDTPHAIGEDRRF